MSKQPLTFHIISIFPDMFTSYLGESILARAVKEKKIKVNFINPRKFASGKYRKVWPDGNISQTVDDRPYGGGPGMVMMAEPIIKAVESVLKKVYGAQVVVDSKKKLSTVNLKLKTKKVKIINFVPSAEKFTTAYAKKIAGSYTDIILVCGRYEGIDARAFKVLQKQYGKNIVDEISIGDYVLTGGEIPAMVLIDCMARQVPGVLGNFDSREEERVASPEIYTRPEVLEYNGKKYKVPPVLLNGNHKEIEKWRGEKK